MLLALTFVDQVHGQLPRCQDGVLRYDLRAVPLPGRCDQIWSSPDGSLIAFAIDTSDDNPPSTRLYWAAKGDGFKPVYVPLGKIRMRDIDFDTFESPAVSPDRNRLFFEVPTAATYATLFTTPLSGGTPTRIVDESDYCVVWDGKFAGSILYSRRRYVGNDPTIHYWCYLRSPRGSTSLVSRNCDVPFGRFQRAWEEANHAKCPSYYGQ
jgi:hypothetical protein